MMRRNLMASLSAAALVLFALGQSASAQTITFVGKTSDVTNYGPAGLNVGHGLILR